MTFFFYNTDADSLVRQGRYPVLLQHGIAGTSGPYSFGEQLGQLAPGDLLLMYENRVGVVAVGTVTGWWDRATHQPPIYYQPGDDGFEHEYRVPVAWWLDLSGCPVGMDELRDRLGYTPRGTITPIVSRQAEAEQLIQERRSALAPQLQTPNQALQQTAGA